MPSKNDMSPKCATANWTSNDLISIKLHDMYQTMMLQILFNIKSQITVVALSLLQKYIENIYKTKAEFHTSQSNDLGLGFIYATILIWFLIFMLFFQVNNCFFQCIRFLIT